MLSEVFLSDEYKDAADLVVSRHPVIIDLGANAGYSIRYWCEKFPFCRVLAVEPDLSNHAVCLRNIELGGIDSRTDVLQAAAVGRSRQVFLDRSADECSFHTSDSNLAGPVVQGITIPNLISRFDASARLDLLKCDIEGGEAELFADCSKWIARFRFVVVETHLPYTIEQLLHDIQVGGGEPRPISLREKSPSLGLALVKIGRA
jgi:FkbM family methyltransferase